MIQETLPTELETFDVTRLCRFFSEKSPQPMVAVEGPTHLIRYLNPAFAILSGKSTTELIGRPFAEAVPEGAANGCSTLLDRVFQTGRPERLVEQEHRQTPRAYWSYSMWAILGPDERPAGVMIQVTEATDIAAFRQQATAMNEALVLSSVRQHELIDTIQQGERERRELENQMFQAQKLESLGLLAGGIAHDLNNMLTPVLGYASLAADCLPEDSPAAPMLEEVATSTRRAADLVQQILAYAGKGRFVIEPVNLSELIRAMDGLLASVISIRGSLRYELSSGLPAVEGDATQLRQVVVNLVRNASEALVESEGTITLRTGQIHMNSQSQRPSSNPARSNDPTVFLEVQDTGCGISPEVIEKIFDPFFTTKFTGRGLGLAVVHGITRGHQGVLKVRSDPGQGTSIRLLLQASTKKVTTPAPMQAVDDWSGTGTILVIDDEKGIRDLAKRILEDVGFTVLLAGNGIEGLKAFAEYEQEIVTVILDLTMPKMGGLEASKQLRSLRPGLPIILMSGYSIEEVTRQTAGQGIVEFVQKPFNAMNLLSAVRLSLGR